MNIAKKISASPNCRYGDPPVTAKKEVPSNAIAPTTAQKAVTTLEVRLENMRALPFVWLVTRRSYREVGDTHRKAIHGAAAGELSEARSGHTASESQIVAPSAILRTSPITISAKFAITEFSEVRVDPILCGAARGRGPR